MIKILDPTSDVFTMQDQSVMQFTAINGKQNEIIFVKYFAQQLVKIM